MIEVSSLKNLTDQIGEEQYPNGICPFMSTVQFVPMQNKMSIGQVVPVPIPGFAPCLGEKCQLWDKISCECCYRFQVRVVSEFSEFFSDIFGALKRIDSNLEKTADIYEQTHPI